MADTPDKSPGLTVPAEEMGFGRQIDIKSMGIYAKNEGYTKPITVKGSWTIAGKGQSPYKGTLTNSFSIAEAYTENGKQILKVKEEIQVNALSPDTKPTTSNILLFIEPNSYRVIREIDEDETTDYDFNINKKEKMQIGERIRVGSLKTVDDKGIIKGTGEIFEELRMSLEIPGALEFCELNYKKLSDGETISLTTDCDIFYETGKLIGLSSTIVEYPKLSVSKVRINYNDPNVF